MFAEDRCPKCHGAQDCYGDHAVNCGFRPGFKQRHEGLVYSLSRVLSLAGIAHTVNDTDVELFKDSKGNVRPADLLVKKWNGDRDLCIDVTVISPFTRHGPDSNALSTAVSRKNEKHRGTCYRHGFDFLAFGASTFGHLHADGVKFLDRVGRCLRDRQLLGDGKDCAIFKDWLVLSIQTGVAKQLVARSSFF